MTCRHCQKPVILQPSAQARAERFGGRASEYILLFPNHADCELKAREQATQELIQRLNSDQGAT